MSAPILAGDWKDDDGQVLDSFLEQAPNPPMAPLEKIEEPTGVKFVPETKLDSGYQIIQPSWSPVKIMPPDPMRMSTTIRVEGGATDGIAFSSDPAQLINIDSQVRAGRIYPSSDAIVITGHTGPLYVAPIGASAGGLPAANVAVSWWNVTR